MIPFQVCLCGIAVVAIISIYFGFKLGIEHEHNRITEEIKEEFKQRFMQKFEIEFCKRVEQRALEIAIKLMNEYKEEEKK